MREIKFRAWGAALNYGQPEMWQSNQITYEWIKKDPGRFEFMQFTGLKDKNEVEIYEGDIVKLHNDIYEVRYSAPGFWVYKNGEEEDSMYDSPIYEVIGNIYQNHELLK